MKIEYNHGFSKEEAYKRVGLFLDKLQEKYADLISGTKKRWNRQRTRMDFKFKAYGVDIAGQVYLHEKKITIKGKIPFIATLFEGEIEKAVREQLDEAFSD